MRYASVVRTGERGTFSVEERRKDTCGPPPASPVVVLSRATLTPHRLTQRRYESL